MRPIARRALPLLMVLFSPIVGAQTAQQKAAARALFDEGRALLKAGKINDACGKFEESLKLAPLLGTRLNLADCYKQQGKTASAWAEFKESAAMAQRAGDDRQQFARDKVAELEKSLSRLTIALAPGAGVPGLEIKHDGEEVGHALLGTAVPVDPGTHVIEASAPGRTSWASKVAVGPAAAITVEIPRLGEPTKYPEPGKPSKPKSPVAASPTEAPRDEVPDPGKTRRMLGIGVGVAGLAGVGAGLFFGKQAMSSWDDAKSAGCDDDGHCPQAGLDKLDDAHSKATIATIAVAAGVAAIAGGIVLYLTAPSAPETVSLAPWIDGSGGGIVVGVGY